MALTQEQVDYWFAQNPEATADEVAAAVQSVGGLEANTGLADMIADKTT
jgi:S-formylglutathione hydrolase FrmB